MVAEVIGNMARSMLIALLVALAGCGGSGGAGMGPRTSYVEFTEDQLMNIAASESHAYRIQEGDVLRIAFPYERDLNQDDVVVLHDGAVSLIGVDRIELAGLTLTQADSVVTAAYAKDYLEPDLSIMVMETGGRQVYVLGQVRNPGLHKLPQGGVGIIGAITVAGGFTEDAAKAGTALVRMTDTGYLVQELDLTNIAAAEYAAIAAVGLEPYDIVYVPRSRMGDFSYFSRTVLQGLLNMTRMAADIKYLSGVTYGRY